MVRLVLIQLRMLTDIIQYVVYHCTLLQLLITVFTSFFQKVQTKRHWNHLVLKMEILIDQNHGMLIPNMFCAFLQIPHHDLVTFFWPHNSNSSQQSLIFMIVRQVAHMRHQNVPQGLSHGRRPWKNMGHRDSDEHWWQKSGITFFFWQKQWMKLVCVFWRLGYCSRGVGSSSVMYVRQAMTGCPSGAPVRLWAIGKHVCLMVKNPGT